MNARKCLIVAVVLCVTSMSMAQWLWWTNDAGNRQWTDSGNWTAYPTTSDDVVIGTSYGTGPIIAAGETGYGFWIHLSEAAEAGSSLTIDGGTLTCGDHLLVGENWGAGHKGSLLVNLGTVNTVLLMVGGSTDGSGGTGYLEVNDGVVNVSWLLAVGGGYNGAGTGGTGHIQLNGGTLNALGGGGLIMSVNGSMDIAGGTLVLPGQITDVTTYGDVTAYNGTGSFVYSFDGTNTAVTAVPEPATLLLIGLGALVTFKGKR